MPEFISVSHTHTHTKSLLPRIKTEFLVRLWPREAQWQKACSLLFRRRLHTDSTPSCFPMAESSPEHGLFLSSFSAFQVLSLPLCLSFCSVVTGVQRDPVTSYFYSNNTEVSSCTHSPEWNFLTFSFQLKSSFKKIYIHVHSKLPQGRVQERAF